MGGGRYGLSQMKISVCLGLTEKWGVCLGQTSGETTLICRSNLLFSVCVEVSAL